MKKHLARVSPVPLLLPWLFLAACGGDQANTSAEPVNTANLPPTASAGVSSSAVSEAPEAGPASVSSADNSGVGVSSVATVDEPVGGASSVDSQSTGALGGAMEQPSGVSSSGNGGSNSGSGGGSGGTQAEDPPIDPAAAGAGGAPDEASNNASLSISAPEMLWTAVRYYAGGTGLGNRASGPEQGPSQTLTVTNEGANPLALDVTLSGPDADYYSISAPADLPMQLQPGQSQEIELNIETNNDALPPAPQQDDGATVLEASLVLGTESERLEVRQYALVLTYVELEPTFGQLLDAFSQFDSEVPAWLRNDANPNPGALPGVAAGTDEVSAELFSRADPDQPVHFEAIARFSPPGLMPFGWYPAGSPDALAEVGALATERDAHTNDKSRMLNPPLARGGMTFEPDGDFGLWMRPDGLSPLYSQDAQNSDGQHRVKVFTLRDSEGAILPNTYLVGGEEASNGDYQDYLFVISHVQPQ